MTKISKFILAIAVATIMSASLPSCKSSHKGGEQPYETATGGSLQQRMSKVMEQSPATWTTLQVPLTIKAEAPASVNISAKAYMTRDSSIYLSFSVLFMEMAVIQITNDSVFAVDKVHKQYVAESISQITSNYPVSVATLQSLFMGQTFYPGDASLTTKNIKNFKLSQLPSGDWCATPSRQVNPFTLSFIFNNDNTLATTAITSADKAFNLSYSDPCQCLSTTLPQLNTLNVNAGKIKINGTLKWNWNKVRIDNPSDNKKLKINRSYTRITASQLLKSFS